MKHTLQGPVGVISNPNSGHNRDHFARIKQQLAALPGIVHAVTESPAEIMPALITMREAGVRVLAINGGDGTASAILGQLLESSLFPQPPVIAILPGGTANMNAGDIGIRGSLLKAVQRFSHWCESDRSLEQELAQRSLLRVFSPASGAVHYGMFLGAGAVLQGTDYAHREIHSRGLRDDFSLALGVIRTVWGVIRNDPDFSHHVRIDIALDDAASVPRDTLLLAISTLQRLAFGMRPFWGSEAAPLRLTLMEQGCTRFARTFFSIARGKPNSNATPASGYYSHNATSVVLRMEGRVNIDGEIINCDGPMQISATAPLEFLQL